MDGFCDDPDEVEARALMAFCVAVGHHFLAADRPAELASKSSPLEEQEAARAAKVPARERVEIAIITTTLSVRDLTVY